MMRCYNCNCLLFVNGQDDEWTDVDNPPTESNNYLATTIMGKNKNVMELRYRHTDNKWIYSGAVMESVVAWRKLPKPYRC